MKTIFNLLVSVLPWPLRRWVLVNFYGYKIGPGARIGWAYVFPRRLVMGPGASVGHFTVVKGLEELRLGEKAEIGRLNWISANLLGEGPHFGSEKERDPRLIVGDHGAITNRHLIDCSNRVEIGRFSIVAGFRSQILTHGIDVAENRQTSAPVRVGEYCFVGTACLLLKGAILPDCSVLAAGSVLIGPETQTGCLYAGVPAQRKKQIPADAAYFLRKEGFVS
jgi:acetyltransferase-like isoleucine patch superfamily enzyme